MGIIGPETLRAMADAIEDPRQIENVESFRRVPELDQHLNLALNRTRKREKEYELPDASTVVEWLKRVLISVDTSDGQSAVLGIFFTNRYPTSRSKWNVAVGIVPMYEDIEKYHIRPHSWGAWQEHGSVILEDRSYPGNDPFMVDHAGGLELIFFKKNPFTQSQPYQSDLSLPHLHHAQLHELALEANVIARALWFAARNIKPQIFREPGFAEFIKANKNDPKYNELYRAWRFKYYNTWDTDSY